MRQLRKHLPDVPTGQNWEDFLDAVSASYQHHDAERELLNRSLDLSTAELMGKNEELRKKNEALDGFVYRVAHDLRSPISNIQAMLAMQRELLTEEEEQLSPLLNKVMHNLEASAQKLGTRVTDLLDMTKLESRLVMQVEHLSFQELTGEIIFNLGSKIHQSGAQIQQDFEAYPTIEFGRENLLSIMGNLIENAIKYRHPDRSPVIQLRTLPDHEDRCHLMVSDNGLGIDLDKSGDRLFGLFNRMHSHVEGSGVGLYLVKKIVEQSGGNVTVESTPGIGTTFNLYLQS
jgi:signal transduction histidine kinase